MSSLRSLRLFSFFVSSMFFILALLATQSCRSLRESGDKAQLENARGSGKNSVHNNVGSAHTALSAGTKKVAELIVGDPDLKDAIQNFTPMAQRATHDFLAGHTAITNPVRTNKGVSFEGKAVLNLGEVSMCTRGERVSEHLSNVFNNSDTQGRATWYGLLEACLGLQESGVHWDEGTKTWKMRDSKAHGANRKKIVGGFLQLDSYAKQNPGMMDACIQQWNEEGHGYDIKDSKGQPRNGYSLDTITSNEKGNLKGQEFSIRCGTQMMGMQALLQKSSGQCINPFSTMLNHFGPLRREKPAREIQGCMKELLLGKTSLRGDTLADIRSDLLRNSPNLRGSEEKLVVESLAPSNKKGRSHEPMI